MTLNAALPSATSLPASCHVSEPASEFVYVSSVLKRFSATVTIGADQLPPGRHSSAQRAGPRVEIITVSSRCFCVHCSPSASGITLAAFALFSAAIHWFHVFGADVMPAFFRTDGLYQRMLARWMFTGTEYRWPLYLIWLISEAGKTLANPACL